MHDPQAQVGYARASANDSDVILNAHVMCDDPSAQPGAAYTRFGDVGHTVHMGMQDASQELAKVDSR